QIREQDTDWNAWLMNKAYRPFDPQLYFEFRLYKDFSSGIADQWMSHGIDLCHFFLDESHPISAVAHGGVFAWHDVRENPDIFRTLRIGWIACVVAKNPTPPCGTDSPTLWLA